MRFTFAGKTTEVPCYFDENDCSFVCTTPQFAQSGDEVKLPSDCFISVTLDGTNFSECEESFKIYSDEIFLTSVHPKCGSIAGGSQITLAIDIDSETSSVLKDLKIGFQPKGKKMHSDSSKAKQSIDQAGHADSRLHVNDVSDAWTCAEGFYENGKIIAKVPKLVGHDPDNMVYAVDVSLNGQQFTGRPVNFRYYDV